MKSWIGFLMVRFLMVAMPAIAENVRMVEGLKITKTTTSTCKDCFLGPREGYFITFENESEELYRVRKVQNPGGNATSEMTKLMVEVSSSKPFHDGCSWSNSYFIYNRGGGLIGWVLCK